MNFLRRRDTGYPPHFEVQCSACLRMTREKRLSARRGWCPECESEFRGILAWLQQWREKAAA